MFFTFILMVPKCKLATESHSLPHLACGQQCRVLLRSVQNLFCEPLLFHFIVILYVNITFLEFVVHKILKGVTQEDNHKKNTKKSFQKKMCRRGEKARVPTCRRHPEPEQSQGLAHRWKMKHAPAEGAAAQGRRVKVEQRRHGPARAVVVMLLLLMTRLATTAAAAAAALLEPIFALESAFAAFALETLLFGRASAVPDGVEVVVRRRCVLLQDVQTQALPVLAAHVHQERVVGDAEDAAGLRGRHALVPDVLERLGKVVVGPGAGRAAARCAVLTL